MEWLGLLQVGSVVGLIVAGGFAGLQRGTIMNLRESNTDLRGRRDDLENDRDEARSELEAERKAWAAKVDQLEGAVRVLTDTVTAKDAIANLQKDTVSAKDAIADLQKRLDVHHRESMVVLTAISDALAGAPNSKADRGGA